MGSLVAGICEEVGFRGYMQVPLRKEIWAGRAITIVSVIFSLAHLDRSWALTVMPIIFFASVLLGVLAYQSQSLIPGIIGIPYWTFLIIHSGGPSFWQVRMGNHWNHRNRWTFSFCG